MPSNRVRSLVCSVLTPPAVGLDNRPDRELVACFLASHDEVAFAALVRRHGPMVRAVCLSILRNPADADDAFQATFLVLVRRAAVIRDRAALGGWLYTVAGRVSRRLRGSVRPLLPLSGDEPGRPAHESTSSFGLREVLEEEIARLPEVYRLAVQACYVAGQTTSEAATLLGWAKGTVLTRLAWARRRLRSRLAARGVGLAVSGFGALLGRPAALAIGRALVSQTTSAAVALAAGEKVSGLVSERSVTLSEGVIRAMAQNKLKWAAGVVLVAVLTGVGIGRWASAGEPGSQPPNTSRATSPVTPPDVVRPVDPPHRVVEPPVVTDSPARTPQPNRSHNPPAPRPGPPVDLIPPQAQSSIAVVGKQFVVFSPVGTWSREVVVPNGNEESTVRVTMKFDEDHLTIRVAMVVERQEMEIVLDADYSITKDSVVFGVVTGSDVSVPAGGRVPARATESEEGFVDQPFSFRFRVDRGALNGEGPEDSRAEQAGRRWIESNVDGSICNGT